MKEFSLSAHLEADDLLIAVHIDGLANVSAASQIIAEGLFATFSEDSGICITTTSKIIHVFNSYSGDELGVWSEGADRSCFDDYCKALSRADLFQERIHLLDFARFSMTWWVILEHCRLSDERSFNFKEVASSKL